MPTPTLTELFTPFTREQVVEVMLQVAEDVGLPIEAWQADSTGRELLEITAQKVADQSETGAIAASAGLLDYATSVWLTLTAAEMYDVERVESTFATGTELLTNTGAVNYPLNAGEVRGIHRVTGKTYTSTTGGVLAPASTLEITLVADEPGSESNAAVGEIDALVTPLFGVTVANTTAFVGLDEESDQRLVQRCRESMAKASPNGPADAYSYYAKTAVRTDDTLIGVTRVNLVQGDLTITVYVADDSGPIDSADLTLVDTYIQENVVPTGYTATVLNATAVPVNIVATVYRSPNSSLSQDNAQDLAEAKLIEYFANAPIGGYVVLGGFIFRSAIIGQIFDSAVGQIIQVVLTTPAADVALNPEEVATLGTVTITLGNP